MQSWGLGLIIDLDVDVTAIADGTVAPLNRELAVPETAMFEWLDAIAIEPEWSRATLAKA